MHSFVRSRAQRPEPVADEFKKNGVTVIVNHPDPAAVKEKTADVPPRKPPPPSLVGVAFNRFRSFRWTRLMIAILWEVAGLGFLALIYLLVTAQGLAELAPAVFGQRMSKLPGFGVMAGFQGWHRLTVGHVAALGLMLFVIVSWCLLIREWVLVHGNRLDEDFWKVRNTRLAWRVAGLALLAADGLLFYRGLVEINSWSSSSGYSSAFVLTIVYVAALEVFSLGSVHLWSKVRRSEE